MKTLIGLKISIIKSSADWLKILICFFLKDLRAEQNKHFSLANYYDLDQMQMTHTSCPLVLFLVTVSQRSFSVAITTVFNVFVSSGGRLVVMLRVELGTMGLHMWKG